MTSHIRIRQLEALNFLNEQGNITRAAEAMGISQPAVSRLLADLSISLGFAVYHRKEGRLHLTQEAKFLVPDIKRILESMQYISESGHNLTKRTAGHLRIACLPGFATSHLPGVIAQFLDEHPGVSVTIEPDRPERIMEWIVGEQYDCGITDSFDGHPAIESETIQIRSVCIFPADHRFAKLERISVKDLAEEKIIHTRRDSVYYRDLTEAFTEEGMTMNSLVETRQFTGACELVCLGVGVSIVSELDARTYEARGLDFRPFTPNLPHKLSLVRPAHRHPSLITLEFLALFEQSLRAFRLDPSHKFAP